jgi:hypothetical protein
MTFEIELKWLYEADYVFFISIKTNNNQFA